MRTIIILFLCLLVASPTFATSTKALETKYKCKIYPERLHSDGFKEKLYACTSPEFKTGVVSDGCLLPVNYHIIVVKGKSDHIITTMADFKKEFTPIDSTEKALSYAAIVTGGWPRQSKGTTTELPNREYMDFNGELTFTKKDGDGYKVRLSNFSGCGCSLHEEYVADYSVSKDGTVKELSRHILSRGKEEKCVD